MTTHHQSVSDTAYWLAVSRVPHIGPVRIERLLRRFGSLRAAWTANGDELRSVLEARPLAELLASRGASDPERELERLERSGIAVLHPGHPDYPALLFEISGRPSVLFVRGTLLEADAAAVAIVGTRRASPYGRQAAERVATQLAEAGVTVVSGLARGIDAVAHRAAVEAGGRTIAVLGCGVDVIYPAEHRLLAEQVIANGALVSEFPPGTKPDAQNFPARNRIISGLSLGTVVVEAAMRSGALITATFAADQGREVFVIPGSVFAPSSEGTNALLRDGARVVRDGQDVLEDLALGDTSRAPRQTELALDEREIQLLRQLDGDPRHIDELAEDGGMTAVEVSVLLVTLELKGLVRNQGANFYVKR